MNDEGDNRPIGIFDSGLGGLTVAAAVRKRLPAENIVYLGDTARVPYGNRSPETVRKFARQDMAFLASRSVKAVVAACNTVSALALDAIRECGLPVSGVILPGVHAALRHSPRSVTILGTRGTIRSGAYQRELLNHNPGLSIRAIPCPLFVPLVEEGILDGPVLEHTLDLYLASERRNPPDILLLGCTHYPLLKPALNAYFDERTRVIDSAVTAADFLADFLHANSLQAPDGQTGSTRYCVTDFPEDFDVQASRFLGDSVSDAERITLPVL